MKETTPPASPLFCLPGFGLLLAFAIAACFPDVLSGRSSFYFRDFGAIGYPVVHHFQGAFQAGEFPLWNPLSNCGAPFFAQWSTMGAYPLSILYLVLPLPWSLNFFCLLHLWIAGIGMYLLARHWTLNNVAGVFAGAAYVFNGIVFASFIWPNYFVALAWMPFVLWMAERAWREGGRWIAGAALASALQLGSGVPELIILTWLVVGTVWLCDFSDVAGNGTRMVLRSSIIVALAAGLMAVQLMPFFDLLIQSQREAGVAGDKWSLPLWGAANFLVPLLHSFEAPHGQYFQFGQEFMSSVYLGLPLVTLAIVGVLKYPASRSWGLLVLCVLAVLLAFGPAMPVFAWVEKVLPAVEIARYPVKFVFVLVFALPLLAALAVKALHVEPRNSVRAVVYSTVLMLALVGGLVWAARQNMLVDTSAWPENFRRSATDPGSIQRVTENAAVRGGVLVGVIVCLLLTIRGGALSALGGIAAIGLLAFDALTHAPNQNPTLPSSALRGSFWDEASGPRPRFGETRAFISPAAEAVLLGASSTNAAGAWEAKRQCLWLNLNLLESVPKINGAATLQVRGQARFQAALYGGTNRAVGALNFLGAAFVSSTNQLGRWERRDGALPLITAGQRVVFAEEKQALAAVLAPGFSPAKLVFLPPAAQAAVKATNGAIIRVLSTNISTHVIEAEVEAESSGPLVIAQSHYPAWKAFVDDAEVPLYLANSAFQSVIVPAGKHRVTLRYVDESLNKGVLISAGTAVIWFLFLIVPRRRAT